jgi:hypothetical protein
MARNKTLTELPAWLSIFIFGLIMSGITAFPLQSELGCRWLVRLLETNQSVGNRPER